MAEKKVSYKKLASLYKGRQLPVGTKSLINRIGLMGASADEEFQTNLSLIDNVGSFLSTYKQSRDAKERERLAQEEAQLLLTKPKSDTPDIAVENEMDFMAPELLSEGFNLRQQSSYPQLEPNRPTLPTEETFSSMASDAMVGAEPSLGQAGNFDSSTLPSMPSKVDMFPPNTLGGLMEYRGFGPFNNYREME